MSRDGEKNIFSYKGGARGVIIKSLTVYDLKFLSKKNFFLKEK